MCSKVLARCNSLFTPCSQESYALHSGLIGERYGVSIKQ